MFTDDATGGDNSVALEAVERADTVEALLLCGRASLIPQGGGTPLVVLPRLFVRFCFFFMQRSYVCRFVPIPHIHIVCGSNLYISDSMLQFDRVSVWVVRH